MLESRKRKIWETTERRQLDLAVVLENVHDPHNISAVLRSCDSVGVADVYVIYDDPQLADQDLKIGKRSSSGARKWIRVHFYRDADECFGLVSGRYDQLLVSETTQKANNIYGMDLRGSTALIFGNEREGISDNARSYSSGSFYIPQKGMVKSLNISVACAVSLYEAFRQRDAIGLYDRKFSEFEGDRSALFDLYLERHKHKISGKRYLGYNPNS